MKRSTQTKREEETTKIHQQRQGGWVRFRQTQDIKPQPPRYASTE